MGVNFIGVGGSGAKYLPFLILAKDLNIPVFIFSDGEDKTVKDLKKNYEKIFGPTDIENAPNITILSGTNFEGYLLSQGFIDLIERAIHTVAGDGAVDKIIKQNDYDGEDGRKKAIIQIIRKKKPLYAKAITDNLTKLPKESLPQKVY